MAQVTQILDRLKKDDPKAAEELLPLVYEELRKLAAAHVSGEEPGQSLQATALVHEAWFKLVGENRPWNDRHYFYRAAAEAMRRILVDRARDEAAPGHGGGLRKADIRDIGVADDMPSGHLLALDEALLRLETVDPQAAELIKRRFFAGLTREEAVKSLGLSRSAAERDWAFAHAWLYKSLQDSGIV